MITNIDADAMLRWLPALASTLDLHQDEINALNVFPIPDGDTGTNMALTVRAGVDALAETGLLGGGSGAQGSSAGEVADRFSAGSLSGARGNSGVILAAYLQALLAQLADGGTPVELARALESAADAAYASVGEPIDGTILSVASAAAEAALATVADGTDTQLDTLVLEVVHAAVSALDLTPAQLPALARAGVVDAGGRGLVVVLESLGELVTGVRMDKVPAVLAAPNIEGCVTSDGAFEVMYALDTSAAQISGLREVLVSIGESVVIAGADSMWSVHVHTDDAGAAIEAGVSVGRPRQIQVNDLRISRGTVPAASDVGGAPAASSSGGGVQSRSGRRLVAVAHGPGMSEVLESAGVVVVGAQGRVSPSAGEFAMAADGTHAREIVILPSSSGIRGAAELAATALRDQGVTVAVIPTRSIVQTLAAVAVHDPGALFSDDVVSMTRAATATHYGGVSISTRDAMTTAGRCVVGDVLGIIEGDVVEIGGSVNEVADRLLHRMLAVGGDLVTVVEGEGAPTDFVADVLNRVRREHPGIEIIRYSGGQPVWPLIIGVE